jgi:type II secretory pathway component PulJ
MANDPRAIRMKEHAGEAGFALSEFLVATLIVLTLSAGIFTLLKDIQGTSGYQTEVLSINDNVRTAMNSLERIIVQAGNNPLNASFNPVTITSSTQVQLCTDQTGSSGGNQGDPDGDILDANENLTVGYNSTARSIELTAGDGTVQTLANYISAFSLQYFDKDGNATTTGANVRRIRVTVTGQSTMVNPVTRKGYGITLTSDFTLPNRG